MKCLSIVLLLLLLLTVSCAREEKPEAASSRAVGQAAGQTAGQTAPAAPDGQQQAGEVVSTREITLSQAAPQEQPEASPQSRQQQLLVLESRTVLPEDFHIGPLEDLVAVDRETQEMVRVATRFLEGLREGTVRSEALLAEVREELTDSIGYYLGQELIPREYRIGAITRESTEDPEQGGAAVAQRLAWMNVRLFGSPGVSEGELYLQRSGGRWYVSDLQIDFRAMSRPYVREQEQYVPTIYRWGIQ